MKYYRTTSLSHKICLDYITKDSIVIDATCGNGHDTLFLCQNSKFCFAFDIQEGAIKNTEALLKANNIMNYQLIKDSHENFYNYCLKCDLVLFNLGYLPKGNKENSTQAEITLLTIKKIIDKLEFKLILLVIYPGHSEGKKESQLLEKFLKSICQKTYNVFKFYNLNQIETAPYILGIEKK
ncbi:MAG: class I SAM-dependent methyltransferase [Erysipelotrichales bacterium]|nr:class I SAM-dependent methyltransferase [Erysipelotrichales bacterium]